MSSTRSRFAVVLVVLSAALLALPGTVLAEDDPPSPDVVTQAATDVTGTTATLHADVTSNNTPTTAYFLYGTSPGRLTSRTPDVAVAAGPGTVPVTAAVTGLTAGTKYYVVAIAENADWVVAGDQTSFDTAPPPAILGSAGEVTYKSAAVHLHVTTNGQPVTITGAVGSGLLRGPAAISTILRPVAQIGPVTVPADGDVVIPVAGLAPNTNYDWAATAANANGKGVAVGSFHTESLVVMPTPKVSQSKVAYGTHVTISGALTKPNVVVTLAEQTAPFTGVIAPLTGVTATADGAGAYAFDIRAEHSARYGVTIDGAAPLGVSNLTRLEVFPAVTAKVQRAKRHRFVVSGRYQPAVAGKVSLFRRGAGRVGTALSSKGVFRFAARALKPGKYEVRVTPAANAGLIAGKSATLVVPKR